MHFSPFLRFGLLALSLCVLSACDSSEERAEKHYQSALELLEKGDVQRALVEFRNVFALDEGHRGARTAYAKTARAEGNIPESYINFQRIVEQYPDDHESRLALTQMAILTQNWDEAERHGTALINASTDLAGVSVAELALQFREAVLAKDNPKMRKLTAEAEKMAVSDPDDRILQRILIEGYSSDGRPNEALKVADRALAQTPNERALYRSKAALLHRLGDTTALEVHLRATVAQFPDDNETKALLVRLLAEEGETGRAEDFLREELATDSDPKGAHVGLITFIRQSRGNEAAVVEIEAAIAAYENNQIFKALKSGILFDLGRQDEAIALLQGIIDNVDTPLASEEIDRYRISLAKMLGQTGNEVGARQLVEQVLANDASQVDALKMSANWLIDADQPDEAINELRRALDQNPDDAQAMTLMAKAHQRAGNPQLSQDLLALAVEASGNAPTESLRYARLLVEKERYRPAEGIAIKALRREPNHLGLLNILGQIYLATEDWGRANQVATTLSRQEDPNALLAGDELKLQVIARKDGREQAVQYLQSLSDQEGGNAAATVALIRANIKDQKGEEALAMAEKLVASEPDSESAKLVLGSTQFALQDYEAAEKTFRKVYEDSANPTAALQLSRVLVTQGRIDERAAIVDAALEVHPNNGRLLWAKASILEHNLDFDGAIAIYEKLYVESSDNIIVTNNLASLLATYREDDASLERAFTVARRLKGTKVPPLQDTYGWILYRRGEVEEALKYLEPAAAGLANDPIVQFHLAKVYQSLGRIDNARSAFIRAVEIAGENDKRTQISEARAEIEKLAAE